MRITCVINMPDGGAGAADPVYRKSDKRSVIRPLTPHSGMFLIVITHYPFLHGWRPTRHPEYKTAANSAPGAGGGSALHAIKYAIH